MEIKLGMLEAIRSFLNTDSIDDEWLLRHISVEFYDNNRNVVITIDHMNCQEYQWLKDEV